MIDYRENNKWTVYIHIVPKEINGYEWDKYYVGITSRNIKLRWGKGSHYKNCPYFYRAIQKYGWDNIQHEVICENLTEQEAFDFEKRLIKELKSNDYNYGYNITAGGNGCTGLSGEKNPNYGNRWNEEQRQKRREYLKEHPRNYTDEYRKKISEASKRLWENEAYRNRMSGTNHPCYGRTGNKHPMYGKHGKEISNSKIVVCLNNNKAYYSASDASKILGINNSKLCMCCRGERNSCGKDENGNPLHWKYYEDYLKENNMTDEEARKSLFFIE